MNAYTLLHAMSGVRAEFVLEARDFLGYGAEKAETGRAGRRLWPALLAAAILALLLAACGYAVYVAAMSYREPQPEDEKQYYYDGAEGSPNEGLHMDLNHGDCALAVHFDTEEPGYCYAFRLDPSLADREDWVPRHLPLSETLKTFSDKRYYPADQVRSYEQALREAGLTREEAETWDYRLSIHEKEGERRLILMIEIADAPELHGTDLIFGWPEGTAEILRDESWGEYQRLEFVVDRDGGNGQRELTKHLLLFHPEGQYLLLLHAADDAFSFEELEALAEGITVKRTGLRYSIGEKPMNWSICGLAEG